MREHLVVPGVARPVGDRLHVVSGGAERPVSPTPDAAVEKNLHTSALGQCRFDALVADQTSGIDKAGSDIVRLKPGIALQDRLRRVSGRQHAKHVLDRKSMSPDDGLAAKDRRVGCDPSEQLAISRRSIPVHGSTGNVNALAGLHEMSVSACD